MEMAKINVDALTPDKGPTVGFVLIADYDITMCSEVRFTNGVNLASAFPKFFSGDLNTIRATLHNAVDEAINQLESME